MGLTPLHAYNPILVLYNPRDAIGTMCEYAYKMCHRLSMKVFNLKDKVHSCAEKYFVFLKYISQFLEAPTLSPALKSSHPRKPRSKRSTAIPWKQNAVQSRYDAIEFHQSNHTEHSYCSPARVRYGVSFLSSHSSMLWASYQIRKIAGCAGNVLPRGRLQRKPLVSDPGMQSLHVRDARAVMHVGIAYPWWRGKRSRHSRRMRTRNFTYLARGPLIAVLYGTLLCGPDYNNSNLAAGINRTVTS